MRREADGAGTLTLAGPIDNIAKTLTLNEHTGTGQIPHWARDLQILLLEDLGELETARILIGGLLASDAIEDPQELRYLERKLDALREREAASR